MTVMDDLVAFLRARLDEREAKARGADIKILDDDCEHLVTVPESLRWAVEWDGDCTYVQGADGANVALAADVNMRDEDWEPLTVGRAEYIADNDPASVLADIEAKRRIIEEHDHYRAHVAEYASVATYAHVLRVLALPYVGHPDYLEEWKP